MRFIINNKEMKERFLIFNKAVDLGDADTFPPLSLSEVIERSSNDLSKLKKEMEERFAGSFDALKKCLSGFSVESKFESVAKAEEAFPEMLAKVMGEFDMASVNQALKGFQLSLGEDGQRALKVLVANSLSASFKQQIGAIKLKDGDQVVVKIGDNFSLSVTHIEKELDPQEGEERAAALAAKREQIATDEVNILATLKKAGFLGFAASMFLSSKMEGVDGSETTVLADVLSGNNPFVANFLGALGFPAFQKGWDEFKEGLAGNRKVDRIIGGLEESLTSARKQVQKALKGGSEVVREFSGDRVVAQDEFVRLLEEGELANGLKRPLVLQEGMVLGGYVKVVLQEGDSLTLPEDAEYAVGESAKGPFPQRQVTTEGGVSLQGFGESNTLYISKLPAGTKFPSGAQISGATEDKVEGVS